MAAQQEVEPIDLFGPGMIMAYAAAGIGDLTFIFIITHYICGLMAFGMFLPKSKGWGFFGKVILILVFAIAFIIPLPLLSLALLIGILLSNKMVRGAVEVGAGIVVAVATGGAGAVVEGAVIAGEAAEVGVAAVEIGEAAAVAGEATVATGEAAGAAAEAGEAASAAGEAAQAGPEAFGQKGPPMEELQKELTGSEPVTEAPPENKGLQRMKETYKKVQDIKEKYDKVKVAADKTGGQKQGAQAAEGGEEEDENLSDAA